MTDPIKTIIDETLAAAGKASERPWVSNGREGAFLKVETIRGNNGEVFGKSFSGVICFWHYTSADTDGHYIVTAANNAEKLALMVRELSDRLTKVRQELGPKEAYVETVTEIRETFERARAIAAGKGGRG